MKVMKRVLCLALVCLMVMTLFSGCGKRKLVGEWEMKEDGVTIVWTFEKDGTGEMEIMGMSADIEWEVKGKTLTIDSKTGEDIECTYSIKGDTMTWEYDGEEVELTKK